MANSFPTRSYNARLDPQPASSIASVTDELRCKAYSNRSARRASAAAPCTQIISRGKTAGYPIVALNMQGENFMKRLRVQAEGHGRALEAHGALRGIGAAAAPRRKTLKPRRQLEAHL